MAKASTRTRRVLRTRPRSLAFAVGAALFPWTFLSPVLAQTTANTLPSGGNVTAGSAAISSSANKLQIDQYSQKAILQWDNFSIGSNAWVNFTQPSSSAIAAGDRVRLDMVGDGLISVSVDQAALNAAAINTGRIEADGGNVILTARSANALLDTVVNNTGVIRANSLVERNGEIVLDGGSAGVVSNTGTLTAAGTEPGTPGGTVKVLGDKVGLFDGTRIDASGDAGGGTVLVGGNYQGKGSEATAARTYVGADASINANAVTSGDGGRVILWSNEITRFDGS